MEKGLRNKIDSESSVPVAVCRIKVDVVLDHKQTVLGTTGRAFQDYTHSHPGHKTAKFMQLGP